MYVRACVCTCVRACVCVLRHVCMFEWLLSHLDNVGTPNS